ncbi:hypothetical protein K456DRAFT_751274 [Colletotrichum gloeosporioides 23]|nr:hypothetical protein K456DRAFT_751274 [Colletotrichum gloeosporioides 23]
MSHLLTWLQGFYGFALRRSGCRQGEFPWPRAWIDPPGRHCVVDGKRPPLLCLTSAISLGPICSSSSARQMNLFPARFLPASLLKAREKRMRTKRRAEKRVGNRESAGETRVEISRPPSFFSNQARISVEPSPTSANFQLFQLPSRRPLVPGSSPRQVSKRRTPLSAQPAKAKPKKD